MRQILFYGELTPLPGAGPWHRANVDVVALAAANIDFGENAQPCCAPPLAAHSLCGRGPKLFRTGGSLWARTSIIQNGRARRVYHFEPTCACFGQCLLRGRGCDRLWEHPGYGPLCAFGPPEKSLTCQKVTVSPQSHVLTEKFRDLSSNSSGPAGPLRCCLVVTYSTRHKELVRRLTY